MDDRQYEAFCTDIDALCQKHESWMRGDYNLDSMMLALADCVKRERDFQTHPLVKSCLDGCVEQLEHAAMDYYVSTK